MSEHVSEKAQSWACPDCSWMHAAHPTYGWSARDDRAIEVHQATLCPWRTIEPCRLGYEEHDGARYCFEHGGFLEAGVQSRRCDRAMSECATCSGRGVWMDEPCSDCEGVGTGAGEGATGQDTGTAWVTRSTDCPEAPAQAHPLTPPAQPDGEASA